MQPVAVAVVPYLGQKSDPTGLRRSKDTLVLPAATILYLTSGKADYLSSRYVSATWDLGEVERDWKEKIVSQNALINKLDIPQ